MTRPCRRQGRGRAGPSALPALVLGRRAAVWCSSVTRLWDESADAPALMRAVGAAGLAAAARLPGLLAAVDQHAAAVRDSLGPGAGAISRAALGGYARGLVDAARSAGWRATGTAVDWARAEWLLVRLVAVAALATEARAA